MTSTDPILTADRLGIWRQDPPAPRIGYRWREIFRVIGAKLDTITTIDTILEIEVDYGEYLELNSEWKGCDEVLNALPRHLPGMSPDWLERLHDLPADSPAIVIWSRSDRKPPKGTRKRS